MPGIFFGSQRHLFIAFPKALGIASHSSAKAILLNRLYGTHIEENTLDITESVQSFFG
jgi:hypothetical protein